MWPSNAKLRDAAFFEGRAEMNYSNRERFMIMALNLRSGRNIKLLFLRSFVMEAPNKWLPNRFLSYKGKRSHTKEVYPFKESLKVENWRNSTQQEPTDLFGNL